MNENRTQSVNGERNRMSEWLTAIDLHKLSGLLNGFIIIARLLFFTVDDIFFFLLLFLAQLSFSPFHFNFLFCFSSFSAFFSCCIFCIIRLHFSVSFCCLLTRSLRAIFFEKVFFLVFPSFAIRFLVLLNVPFDFFFVYLPPSSCVQSSSKTKSFTSFSRSHSPSRFPLNCVDFASCAINTL